LKGFERLLNLEIIRPLENISKCPKEFQMVRLLMEPTQIKDAILKSDSLPYVVKRWGIE
jgi:origin recognition complex subunit 4